MGRLDLPSRNGLNAAAPYLTEKSAAVEYQRHTRRNPGIDIKAQHRRAEEDQEKLQQQRRALENLDETAREPLGSAAFRRAPQCNQQAADCAAGKGDHRQADGPFGRFKDEEEFRKSESAHYRRSG